MIPILLSLSLQETPWIGQEHREDSSRPPNMTVFAPHASIEPEFTVSKDSRGFADVWINGSERPIRVWAKRIESKDKADHVRVTLPIMGQEGDTLEYRIGAQRGGQVVQGPDRTVCFVSRTPTSVKAIPETPKPYKTTTPSPPDWRDQIIYFAITDRFCDGDPSNNRLGYAGYDSKDPKGAHGGDFKGLAQRLDYLKRLGATAIWITPVLQNYRTYHGYATVNFLMPDRRLGTLDDLRSFVDAAHKHGIYVILDIVINHTADLIYPTDGDTRFRTEGHPQNFYYLGKREKVLPLPVELRDPERFHNHGNIDVWDDYDVSPSHTQTGHFFGLDDLRTENPEVRNTLIAIYKYWLAQTDVDGFRVDTVKHIDRSFWKEFCPAIRTYAGSIGKKNFFLFGECYRGVDETVAWYTGTRSGGPFLFDGMLHFPMFDTLKEVFRKGLPPIRIGERTQNACLYHDDALNVLFLDNHDVPRLLHDTPPELARVALAFLFTARGIPCLYYGTEQGFRGGDDPANREDLFDYFDEKNELYRWIAKLARLRHDLDPLRKGNFVLHTADIKGPGVCAFSRITSTEEVFVILNTAGESRTAKVTLNVPPGTILVDALTGSESQRTDAELHLTLPAYAVRIYRLKR